MALQVVVPKTGRRASEEAKDRTLAITLNLRKFAPEGSLSFEDIQEAFGGDRPADVLKNIINYAIKNKLAE